MLVAIFKVDVVTCMTSWRSNVHAGRHNVDVILFWWIAAMCFIFVDLLTVANFFMKGLLIIGVRMSIHTTKN